MNKTLPRKRDRIGRTLDSCPVYMLLAFVLFLLLASFYAVLLVNMNAINQKTEDLKDHPYAVTVAAGRAETLLMQVRTLDNRLAYAHTPEMVDSVKTEFASIDEELQAVIDVMVQRHRDDPEKAHVLVVQYAELCEQQQALIELSQSDASDEAVQEFLSDNIDPSIDTMLANNTDIIEEASQSFDQLCATVAKTREDAIGTATVLMAAVLIGLVLFFVVIKRKNRRQEELEESLRCAVAAAQDANEAKSRFLSSVSHDIRTPLTAIIGLADIAMEHAGDRARVMENLEKVQLSSHHLLNLVNDVLDMSKIESGQIDLSSKPFDLRAMVETLTSIILPQADTKQLVFSVTHVEVEDGLVLGDEMRVSQVLINLLGNAVKYTEPNGMVNFTVKELAANERDEFAARVERSLGECDRVVRFVVEDDGIGMSRDFVKRVFEPFEREDVPSRLTVEGTGLGMAIAKNLVDLMGGTIEVQSKKGCGSRFVLTLAFEVCEGETAQQQLEEKPTASKDPALPTDCESCSWSQIHVLLAEDNEIIGEIAEEIIGSTGATVERAWNGLEVLELLEGEPEDRFDLIFMDIQMPGMDGLEAAHLIVERYAEAGRARPPIVATTANAYEEDRQRAFSAGMDGFAVKPISRSEVCHLFDSFSKSKGDGRGAH